jgi:YesN/AraC family two-component response regulator
MIALDGKEGLAQFKQQSPDLVITDLLMAKVSGREMLEQIEQISSKVNVIVISGYPLDKTIRKNVEANCSSLEHGPQPYAS